MTPKRVKARTKTEGLLVLIARGSPKRLASVQSFGKADPHLNRPLSTATFWWRRSGARAHVGSAAACLIDLADREYQILHLMDPFATNYFNEYAAYDNGMGTGTGTVNSDRSGPSFPGFTIPPQSYYNAHRASDPGYFARPSLPAEDSLDLSRFDLLARSAVNTLQVQDVIKPAHNTPWVGPQQHRVRRESYRRPTLLRSPYAKSEPLLRHDVYSDAADSAYTSQWPGMQSATNHYNMNMHELEQDYQPLPEVLSPTGGAENQSTVSDGRLINGAKARKCKRPLTQCLQCGRQPRNLSDSKKHALTHTKPYRCTEQDCTRKDGFATENDLQRHRKSVHNLLPTVGSPAGYICAACIPEANAPSKFWPRRDNFKAHIKRKHPHHHESTLIEASRRRLRPGDDRSTQLDSKSVRDDMHSAQSSQAGRNENTYDLIKTPGLSAESSFQSESGGVFGPESGLAMSNEQPLVGMQGHTVDQYGNMSMLPIGYRGPKVEDYINEAAEANYHGNQPNRLLTILSEAANNLDYSANPFCVSETKQPRRHAPDYGQPDLNYKEPASYPCQHPDCNKVSTHEYGFPHGHRVSSAS